MNMFKKILTLIMISFIITASLVICSQKVRGSISGVTEEKPVKIGVLLHKFDDAYISLVRESLEEIERENEGKVKITFFDGKEDQSIQNDTLDTLLKEKDVDLLFLNLVDTGSTQKVINKIKENNIPVILFNREPIDIEAVKSYNKSYFVGTKAEQAGVLQGKILVNLWNNNKASVDKNGDNIMQYIMLMGQRNNLEAIARTKYSVLTIDEAGIKTQELASNFSNWEQSLAKDATEQLFLKYGDKIEAIIANNDSMAIGAIEALQKYSYNNGDKTRTIAVVGVDAIPVARDLIRQGFMTGTVIQDAPAMAKAMYTVGMNLVNNKKPLDGTEYKFDETGVAIRIPYKEYTP